MAKSWQAAESVEVLNGTARIGHTVAVAVGDGKYGGGMRLGTIAKIERHEYKVPVYEWVDGSDPRPSVSGWQTADGRKRVLVGEEDRTQHRVTVSVTDASGYTYGPKPYLKPFEHPQRIVLAHVPAQATSKE